MFKEGAVCRVDLRLLLLFLVRRKEEREGECVQTRMMAVKGGGRARAVQLDPGQGKGRAGMLLHGDEQGGAGASGRLFGQLAHNRDQLQ